MKAFHRNRLLKLADRLDEVDPKHFNMETWGHSQKPCQTAGCAVGYAATIPGFRRAGLSLKDSHGWVPQFGDQTGFFAAMAFFALTEDEADHLFYAAKYDADRPTPKTVAKRIRKFVESQS